MELIFPDLAYDCLTCGKGCRAGWRVPVDDPVRPGIQASQASQTAAKAGYQGLEDLGGRLVLGHKPDHSCVFLTSESLCSVHSELGLEAKPLQCQQFPFLPVNTPDGVVVGMSFFCKAVQEGHGRPAAEHRPQVESLVQRLQAKLGGTKAEDMQGKDVELTFNSEKKLDWKAFKAYEARVRQALEGEPYRDLWDLCQESLGGTPRKAVPEDTGQELMGLFVSILVGLAEGPDPAARQTISQAVTLGKPFHSGRLQRQILPPPLESPNLDHYVGCAGMPAWQLAQLKRYLGHLVFRKFLVHGASILSQTLTLLVLIPVLDFYTRLSADMHDREPQVEDFYFALDTVEGELVTHAQGAQPLFAYFETAMVNHAE